VSRIKTKIDETTLPFATIAELNLALQNREISCVELTKFFVRRLEKNGPQYNALACSVAKAAHHAAKDVDDDLKHGRLRGPLQGVPYGAKDLLAYAKHPTTWGAKPFEHQVFDYDARAIERLSHAQAILIGKLSMIELAGGGGYSSASASLQGPCMNPWNRLYWAGGSSSGSGAAVAAGLVPFALGSETSGSILTPASYCGLSGLRPTYGLVSRYGAMALSWTLDKIGVLARTAEDCGLVLHTIAGGDSDDPGSAHKSFYYMPQFDREWRDMRLGYAEIDFSDWPDPPLRPALQEALHTVKSFRAHLVEMKIPAFPYGPVISAIIDSEAASVFETFIKDGRVDQLADQSQIDGLKASLTYSAIDYLKAMRIRSLIQDAFDELFESVDLLIAPTRFSPPERADIPFDETPPKRPEQKGLGAGLIEAANLCGLPALTIPCGFAEGLPVGLQIVGPAFSENTILAFGREFQNRTDFHRQHPAVA
jgi:aspartyl-tRNA(Asn)/glutamyl-tRNA(Gln) amidotransferase subunit A